MRSRFLAVLTAATFVFTAHAEGDALPQSAAPEQPAPTSQARDFVIPPEDSDKVYTCPTGRLLSALATALGEHRVVSIVLLDLSNKPIPQGAWSAVIGFRLERRQNIKVRAIMICG